MAKEVEREKELFFLRRRQGRDKRQMVKEMERQKERQKGTHYRTVKQPLEVWCPHTLCKYQRSHDAKYLPGSRYL